MLPPRTSIEMSTMTPTYLLPKGAALTLTEYKALQVERARIDIIRSAHKNQLARRQEPCQLLYDFVKET